MTDVKCLAYQYLGSKRKKKEIDTQIKKLEQQLLDTEELGNLKLLLSNEGGQKTYQGITVETKRDHVWDQDRLHEVFSTLSNEDLPECVTVKKTTTYKID